jgi:hypothetical protein
MPGFPDGPFGKFLPFKHPTRGGEFHARDTFDCRALGFDYDVVPRAEPPELREPPFLAVFEDVDVTKMEMPLRRWRCRYEDGDAAQPSASHPSLVEPAQNLL